MAASALPSEIVDLVLAHLIDALDPDTDDATASKSPRVFALETTSLVSRSWRGPSQRLLVQRLVIRLGSHARQVVDGTTSDGDSGLGESVRKLVVVSPYGSNSEVPTTAALAQDDAVSCDELVALLRQTPPLKSFDLHFPAFTSIPDEQILGLEAAGAMSRLRTLRLSTAGFDREFSVVGSLLHLAPAVVSLSLYSLTKLEPSPPRLLRHPAHLPALVTLELSGPTFPTHFLYLALLSLPTIHQITTLRIVGLEFEPLDHVPPILKLVGPTLARLHWLARETFAFAAILPSLSTLEELQLYPRHDTENIDILRALPATVHTLRCPSTFAAISWAQALSHLDPKPSGLKMFKITLGQQPERKMWAGILRTLLGQEKIGLHGQLLTLPGHSTDTDWVLCSRRFWK